MAIFKCKMCGGTLEVNGNESVLTCEYCGSTQTLPKLDDDRRANLYDRANHFRRNNEFDKAMGIYEKILNEDNMDAEAYWSLVLCQYGIEYVEDPVSHKRVPTVNRAQYISIYADENYKAALQYADVAQRSVYEQEAKAIDEIQKGILAISQKEEPFDVFICYKETDNNGRRTPDSVLANDLYHQLTQEGFKVFFSRITLEDKLGSAYEPYIFAALNSAKVMVVLGTKPEYFNAVWVRNEWSRYMTLIRGGAKKMLIPAYRDMDPYDLPEEFSHLQAQDMSKLGFMQDLIRGVKKIVEVEVPKITVTQETTIAGTNVSVESLLKRVFLFLEDGEWNSADEYCEKALDIDAENANAYLGKLMAELHIHKQEQLKNCKEPFDQRNSYQKALRFADEVLKNTLIGYIEHINKRNEEERLLGIYTKASNQMNEALTEDGFKDVAKRFDSIIGYKDSEELMKVCLEKAEIARKDAILTDAQPMMTGMNAESYERAIKLLLSIPGWRDADEKVEFCQNKIEEIKAKKEKDRKDAILTSAISNMTGNEVANYEAALQLLAHIPGWKNADEYVAACKSKIEEIKIKTEADQLERERKQEEDRIAREIEKKKRARNIKIAIPSVAGIAIAALLVVFVLIPFLKVNSAVNMMATGNYTEAKTLLESTKGFGSEGKLAVINALPKFDTGSGNNTNFDLGIRAILGANEPINVKYNLAGGNAAGDYFTYETPESFAGLLVPTKEGYRFQGWSLEGYQYSKDKHLTLNLCALWNDGYTITYNLDGGKANNSTEYHKDGESITLERPVREGYTFIGWTGTDLSAGTVDVTIPAGSYGDREYTAHWAPNEYTFTLDANGGKVEKTSVAYQYDSNYVLPVPTKEYYKFIGWYNGDVQYKDGEWPRTGDAKLTAKWEPIRYAIRYELNGGTNASNQRGSYTIEFGEIKFDNPTRTGYKFMGWYADSSYKKKVTSIPEGSHGDVTIYAKWEIIEYTITYKLDGGKLSGTAVKKFTVNDLPVTLPTATKSGMIFLNWGNGSWDGNVVDKITVCGDVTVEASYLDPNLELSLSKDGTYYSVTDYGGNASTITIPAYYKGIKVAEVGGLDDCYSVTKIKLPKTIRIISYGAFENCENLKSINIPNGVTEIPDYAFADCESLSSLILPETITSIGEWAFYWCKSLESINLPESLIEIKWDAFAYCESLERVYIPSGIKELTGGVFSDCTNLKIVILPGALRIIGNSAFEGCSNLKKLVIPESVIEIVGGYHSAFKGCYNVKFYCEAALPPEDWDSDWNQGRPVVWGYTGN